MQNLSPTYKEVKRLRSAGNCPAAIAKLRSQPPTFDADAFEAVVCLFVCGDIHSALHVCRTHPWKEDWARDMTAALTERFTTGNPASALVLARKAVSGRAPPDAAALYLLLLHEARLTEEAQRYISTTLESPPFGETFLLTAMAETALAAGTWREAYRAAAAVIANDPDDYRALLVLSAANFEIGNIHESLGNATRAMFVKQGAPPAILQIMRCQNTLGDYYAALGAFEKITVGATLSSDAHVELATAYLGIGDRERAITEYRAALHSSEVSPAALRALIALYADDRAELDALVKSYSGVILGDIECVYALGLAALSGGDLQEASARFAASEELSVADGLAYADLPWPVPEPRLRHDCEQLTLLERRGKLDEPGRRALDVLKRYYRPDAQVHETFAPPGEQGEALNEALCTTYYMPGLSFSGRALGENDYGAIEETYLSRGIVVIDDFLSAEALSVFRRFCEEATVWKINNERGYVGALLARGFSHGVLLSAADELRKAMPRVLAREPLLQAWGFKYDQRMQGINMHADFAKVNVNFWLTPDEACADPTTGGMVVYDVPVPANWTFYQYNNESERLSAYVKVRDAKPVRVPYRANRCVLFDSSLIHITDEMHFKAGYENRRVNVTLLLGRARPAD